MGAWGRKGIGHGDAVTRGGKGGCYKGDVFHRRVCGVKSEPEPEPGISVLSLDRINRIDRIFRILAFGLFFHFPPSSFYFSLPTLVVHYRF